jgi:predicted MFS family arabinose efflux permease
VAAGFVAATVALAAFVAWELRHDDPMLDPRYFRIPEFRVGAATITLIFFVMFGMFFLLPQFLQFVQDRSPLGAAVLLLPSGLTLILVAPRGPALAARIGAAASSALGLAAASGFILLSRLQPDTAYPWVAAALVLMAAGSALAMPPATSAIVGSLPPAKAGVGSAVNDVTREVGGALGIAVFGSVAAVLYRHEIADTAGLDEPTRTVFADSIGSAAAAGAAGPGADAIGVAQAAFSAAIGSVFAACAALLALGAAYYLRQHRTRRRTEAGAADARTTPCSVPCAR